MELAGTLKTLFACFTSGERMKEEDWVALEATLDEERNGFVARLRAGNHHVSETDIRICMTKELGPTWRQMAVVFFLAPESVRKRYQRLKKTIFAQ